MAGTSKRTDPLRDQIVGRFTQLRTRFDLSQAQVARDCKIPQTVVSAWENEAKQSPRLSHLAKVCARYGWSPTWLLLGEGDPILTVDQLGTSAAALSGQATMLARVEFEIQAAMQRVRADFQRRQGPGTDGGAVQAAEAVASPPGRRKRRSG